MRASIRTLLPTLVLSLAACVSGRTIYVGEPAPVQPPPPRPVAITPLPAPAPVPQPREALEVTLGRPARGQVPIQLSRPSYVAIFEIVPNQGVTLVQPTSTQRRRVTQAGVSAVGAWWGDRRTANESQPSRFIYVVAADQPLRLSDQAYQSDYWQRALGVTAYRGTNLYATMRAISRVVVPAVTEQDWAEDMLAIAPTYARQSPQQVPTARVYCPDGSVREVPLDFADRAICPMRVGSNDPGRLTRPDSAFNNGRRIDSRGPRGPGRVSDPNDPHYGARNDPPRNDPPRGRPAPTPVRPTGPATPVTPVPANPTPVTPTPARPPRRDVPAARPTPTPEDRHEAKREEQEAKQEAKRDARDERKDAKSAEQEAKKAERDDRKDAKKEEQADRKDERAEAKDARNEAKSDAKDERRDAKPEPKAEPKQDARPEAKDEPKNDARPESKPEAKNDDRSDAKNDSKPEPKDDARQEQKDSSRDDRGEAKEEQKSDKQQPDSDRRGQGRPSQAGKPNDKN